MDDVLKTAEDVGMTPEQGETATGGIMSFLKSHLPNEQFQMLESKIPGVEEAVQKYTTSRSGTSGDADGGFGGMLGSAISSISGSTGIAGGSTAGLMAMLASKGISPSMVQQFVVKVGPLIKEKCGIDISQYLGDITGGTAAASAAPTGSSDPATPTSEGVSTGNNDVASNLMGQAMGMFGK